MQWQRLHQALPLLRSQHDYSIRSLTTIESSCRGSCQHSHFRNILHIDIRDTVTFVHSAILLIRGSPSPREKVGKRYTVQHIQCIIVSFCIYRLAATHHHLCGPTDTGSSLANCDTCHLTVQRIRNTSFFDRHKLCISQFLYIITQCLVRTLDPQCSDNDFIKHCIVFLKYNIQSRISRNCYILNRVSYIRKFKDISFLRPNRKITVHICNCTDIWTFYFYIYSNKRFAIHILYYTFYGNSRIFHCFLYERFCGKNNLFIHHRIRYRSTPEYFIQNVLYLAGIIIHWNNAVLLNRLIIIKEHIIRTFLYLIQYLFNRYIIHRNDSPYTLGIAICCRKLQYDCKK